MTYFFVSVFVGLCSLDYPPPSPDKFPGKVEQQRPVEGKLCFKFFSSPL